LGYSAFKSEFQAALAEKLQDLLNGLYDQSVLLQDSNGNPVAPTFPAITWRVNRIQDKEVRSRLVSKIKGEIDERVTSVVKGVIKNNILVNLEVGGAADPDDNLGNNLSVFLADELSENPTFFNWQFSDGQNFNYTISGQVRSTMVEETFIGQFPNTTDESSFIYTVNYFGELSWFRHTRSRTGGEAATFLGPHEIATDWSNAPRVFTGSGDVFYRVTNDGNLHWYEHTGFNTGTRDLVGPRLVGTGWRAPRDVFSGSDCVVYVLWEDGTLMWYLHTGQNFGGDVSTWLAPVVISRDWQNVRHAFSMGAGIIYAIRTDGTLWWYHHKGYKTGGGPETMTGGTLVGWGWDGLRHVFSPGYGIIYGIADDGTLYWYRHNGFAVGGGINTWQERRTVNSGWTGIRHAFAILPREVIIR
jgi:hypothetical protein